MDGAGRDCVDPDVRAELCGHGPHEVGNASLGGPICGVIGRRAETADRTYRSDNAAPAATHHLARHRTPGQEDGFEIDRVFAIPLFYGGIDHRPEARSEEHTSELHSLHRNSYAVFCLK